ncbi:MAG: DNA/RNA non-specific endonuclease [Treponema sp.]|nr:DNA/RNA non-specific endonuclease [Treponema sp.]
MNMKKITLLFSTTLILISTSIFTSCKDTSDETAEIGAITFYPEAGVIDSGTEINFSCETKGVSFYYIFDNSRLNVNKYPTSSITTKASSCTITANHTVYVVAQDTAGNLSKRYSASYSISGTENTALYFGNPSNATTDSNAADYLTNYLLEEATYTVSFNNETHNPNWVGWHLCSTDLGSGRYDGDFMQNPKLPDEFYKVRHSDYTNGNFDRGHMCPNADRNSNDEDSKGTFYTTNIVPQTANNNQKVWATLENYERRLVSSGVNEAYIFSGPYYDDSFKATDKEGTEVTYLSGKTTPTDETYIKVPTSTWKIIIAFKSGEEDRTRITAENTTVIAVKIPNRHDVGSDWKSYTCTIDDIETLTGYDFFANLPDAVENALEATVYSE